MNRRLLRHLQVVLLIRRISLFLFLIRYVLSAIKEKETTSGTGITANVINGGDNVLYPGENQNITLRITSSTTTPDTSWASMKATLAEGFQKTLNANISIVQLIPVITTSPSFIDTGMVRGNQKIATFNISNAGEETLRNARIEGPSTSWMSLTVNRAIGDIQPGVSKTIGIMFSPPTTLSQGVYDDRVVIYSDNHIPYTYHVQVTVTSNAVGNVLFDVLNELMEDVPNASLTIQHQTLTELIYSLRTAADGTVMLYDIPEGRYSFNISATGHKSYSGTFVVSPGITTTVPIALEVTLVQVEWSVTPVVIQDRYEIIITQTFVTNVPTPVLIIEPPNINLPALQPGQVFNGEFKVTNYGLIEVYDVVLDFPRSIDDYDIEVMTSAIPNKIGAMKSITVPYRITRRITTASLIKSLFEEVMGYGGATCVKTLNIAVRAKCVICPNTAYQRIVEKLANYFVSISVDCPSSVTSGTTSPSTYTGGGGSVTIVSSSTGGQTGSGNIAGTYTNALQTGNNCECKDNCEKVCGNPDEYCIQGKCTKVTIDYVDARVDGKKGVFVEVQELLSFTGNKTGQSCEFQYKWNLGDGRTEEAQNLPFKDYATAGVYYPSFTVSCKKCGPSKSDQVMVVVGCPDTYADPTMCCVAPGKLVPDNPIEDLSKCPNRVKNTNWQTEYDGCTWIPDNPGGGDLTAFVDPIGRTGACDFHDRCFQTCGSGDLEAARLACDDEFKDIAMKTCQNAAKVEPANAASCMASAEVYYIGLRRLAKPWFEKRQKQVCNCCQ